LIEEAGWSPDIAGKMQYLELGDADDFDWLIADFDRNRIMELINSKMQLDEHVGLVLARNDSCEQIDLLTSSDGSLLLLLSGNRRVDPQSGWTDFHWYLQRLLPLLSLRSELQIESLTCTEHR